MRKFIVLLLLLTGSLGLRAAQSDAFKGIYPPTDKKVMKSLNGTWHLKVIRGVNRDPQVPERDATWGTIPVPGCWEQYGFSKARYSLPDSLTGYYRTSFSVPAEWKGQRVCIRLDGVLRGYDLWLNGQQVGTWEMPYNTCLFDLTPISPRRFSRAKSSSWPCTSTATTKVLSSTASTTGHRGASSAMSRCLPYLTRT